MTRGADPRLSRVRRPYWVLAIVAAYLLILAGCVGVPWFFPDDFPASEPVFLSICVGITLLLLAGLMFVPLQVRRQRPLTRRAIWIPLIVTGCLAGFLAYGLGLALWELLDPDVYKHAVGDPFLILILPAAGAWSLWSGLFFLLTRRRGRTRVALALHRWLLAGTLLELLVAVPAHIVVRRRTECCAGIMTGSAIGLGVIMALLAFGPAVALLYVQRWRQIRPPLDPAPGFDVGPDLRAGNGVVRETSEGEKA